MYGKESFLIYSWAPGRCVLLLIVQLKLSSRYGFLSAANLGGSSQCSGQRPTASESEHTDEHLEQAL